LIMFPYEDAFAVALVVSAFLALHLRNVAYAVISFGVMFTALSALYFSLGGPFAAVFQLVVAVGTIAVFFLAGEMLTPKRETPQKLDNKILGVIIAFGLSFPSILLDFEPSGSMKTHNLPFSSALWEFRALDVIGQGVVVLALALGVVMVLKERKNQARRKEY